MEAPAVLVVMPLFNARPFVRAAIESILAQGYPRFTLLVINDGSTDGSEQEAAVFTDHRVQLWHQQNQGPGAAMNRALNYALEQRIPYLARMDADDISLPRRLEIQLALLEKHPAAAVCSANCRYIDADTEWVIGTSTVSTSPALIRREIESGLRGLIQGACVFRTAALADIGGYRLQFRRAEEVDLFLRLSKRFELRNTAEYLYHIRVRSGSLSTLDVHQNVLYQYYALECAHKRRQGKAEQDFESFSKSLSTGTKFRIWREESLLKLWRAGMRGGGLPAQLLAALLDPRRVAARILRRLIGNRDG